MNSRFVPCHLFSIIQTTAAAAILLGPAAYCADRVPAPDTTTNYGDQVIPTVCQRCGSRECRCELVCCPQKVSESEKVSIWKVTCEYVCIPGFRFPWECKANKCGSECLVCGTVRAVNVLAHEEYECSKCGYEWQIKCVRRSGESTPVDCRCPHCAESARIRLATEIPARKR